MEIQDMQKSENLRKQYLLNFKRNGQILILKEKEKKLNEGRIYRE
ncbi:MAG: hypothetical protein ACTHL3_06920 [Candidatus Nitrosocosmicus sp.]